MELLTLVLFILGLVFLIVGAEWLVRGASSFAVAIGISPLVVGLTVVAFGTSAPELAVGVQGAIMANIYDDTGFIDVALGNVLGSNIANILLILGLAALFAPLTVRRQLLRFDVLLMIVISGVLYFLASDGSLSRLDGLLLFTGILLYTGWSLYKSRQQERQKKQQTPLTQASPEDIQHARSGMLKHLGQMVAGLVLLVFGSDWLVDGATQVAAALGVSELIIGLTIVAVGTSLPEVATSIAASLKGERDLAVGNAVGSNIFNILLILGATSMISSTGMPVGPEALRFDFPVMLAVALICVPIFYTDWTISRWEGALFLGYYVAYIVYLVLLGTNSSLLPLFTTFMFWALLLSLVVVIVDAMRAMRSQRHQRAT